jgi:hypothetical protein
MMVRAGKRVLCVGGVSGAAVLGWLLWRGLSARPVALTTVALAGVPAAAEADEVRTFAVTVDGKAGGTYTIATVAKDGVETTTVTAEVKVKTVLYTYVYELNSVEVWRNGRLSSVESKSNDDGKKRTVTATAGERDLTVTVNADARKIPGDVITATGVRVPAADKARDAVLFDTEDGSETAVRVEPLGACRAVLNGQVIDGTRFKLTGKDVASEWWFDKNGRVLRQEMKWDGHKVVLELTGVK